jgi:hypothetical protein
MRSVTAIITANQTPFTIDRDTTLLSATLHAIAADRNVGFVILSSDPSLSVAEVMQFSPTATVIREDIFGVLYCEVPSDLGFALLKNQVIYIFLSGTAQGVLSLYFEDFSSTPS